MPIKPLELDTLKEKSSSLYEAIVVMGKRARQINDDLKIQYNQRIEQLAAQPVSETGDGEEMGVNPEQIKISIEFEKMPKPSELSIQEFLSDQIDYRYRDEVEE